VQLLAVSAVVGALCKMKVI